jgi:hypothetical protein
MNRTLPWLILVVLGGFGIFVPRAQSQVLVYKLQIGDGKGINYSAYEGGYFVAPLLGGTGSFLLTSLDTRRSYVEAPDTGKLYTAVNDEQKKAVIGARTGAGSAVGAMVAYGDIDHRLHVNAPTLDIHVRVAKTLSGTVVSYDDESERVEPTVDGSVGVAGMSSFKAVLDEDETWRANKAGLTLPQTVEQLKLKLEREGYGNEDAEEDPDAGEDEDDDDAETPAPEADASLQAND